MWKDERKSKLIRDIIVGIVLVALLAGLALAMLKMRERTEAEDAALASVQTQQREEQTVAKQEGVATIEAEYEKDMQTVREYLPGIVCWGDSITAGSAGNISYPYLLQKYIDTYICDVYDFRLSIENADEYSRLDWDDYTVDIPVINMGAGQEDTNTILGRSGVVPYVVGADFIIPAETTPVPIVLKSSNGKDVSPLTGGSAGVNNVTINGIEGTLSIDSNSYKLYSVAQYYFVRSQPGDETPVPAGSVITTAAAELYKDYLHIVCIGTFGGFEDQTGSDIDNLVAQTRQMVERQTKNSDRYLVLGPCSYNGYWNGGYVNMDIVDSAMMQAFGNHYINVRKYLCEDGITDYNLKATDQDMMDAKGSVVPESFRSTTGASELNGKAYELIGKLVYDRMDRLGYFDEIRDELFIKESIKAIQKDDPQYFDRLLKSSTSLLK